MRTAAGKFVHRTRSILIAFLCITAALLANSALANEAVMSIPIAEDASVNSLNPDGNLNTLTTRGGLFSGSDNFGSDYQFYLKFNLPRPAAGQVLESAALVGTYTGKYGSTDSFHQISFVPDDSWSQTTMTFNNRPALGPPTGAVFNAFGATVATPQTFDVTNVARGEFKGDGVLSLNFMTIDGRLGDLEFFASREFDPALAFHLNLKFASAPRAIPLPPAAWTGLSALVLLAAAKRPLSRLRQDQ